MTSLKQSFSMQHPENNITTTAKKTWSDPAITILSVKNDTLGGGATTADATTNS